MKICIIASDTYTLYLLDSQIKRSFNSCYQRQGIAYNTRPYRSDVDKVSIYALCFTLEAAHKLDLDITDTVPLF